MARARRQDAPPLARARRGRRSTRRSTARRSRAAIPGAPRRAAATGRRRREEQQLCEFWRDHELRLLRPQLIVTVGGLAARRLLGVTSVTECVGVRYELDGAVAIPLPHPSGASSWLNAPANRARVADAVALVHAELARLGSDGPATLNP